MYIILKAKKYAASTHNIKSIFRHYLAVILVAWLQYNFHTHLKVIRLYLVWHAMRFAVANVWQKK